MPAKEKQRQFFLFQIHSGNHMCFHS